MFFMVLSFQFRIILNIKFVLEIYHFIIKFICATFDAIIYHVRERFRPRSFLRKEM